MYKVTNKMKDIRKFRDSNSGRDILVDPKGFVITNNPPKECEVWKIEEAEQTKTKKIKEEIKK